MNSNKLKVEMQRVAGKYKNDTIVCLRLCFGSMNCSCRECQNKLSFQDTLECRNQTVSFKQYIFKEKKDMEALPLNFQS